MVDAFDNFHMFHFHAFFSICSATQLNNISNYLDPTVDASFHSCQSSQLSRKFRKFSAKKFVLSPANSKAKIIQSELASFPSLLAVNICTVHQTGFILFRQCEYLLAATLSYHRSCLGHSLRRIKHDKHSKKSSGGRLRQRFTPLHPVGGTENPLIAISCKVHRHLYC